MEPISPSSTFGVVRTVAVIVVAGCLLAIAASDGGPPGVAAGEIDLESPAALATDLQPPDTGCTPGSLPVPPAFDATEVEEAESFTCVPVVDRTDEVKTQFETQPLAGHFASGLDSTPSANHGSDDGEVSVQGDSSKGIFDVGTIYLDGQLPVAYSATFRAYMGVYPHNVAHEWDNDPEGVSGYYITATNRTDKGVEFLYRLREPQADPSQEKGWFMIYDWSCLPDWPCDNGAPNEPGQNNFVRAWRLDQVPCWYKMQPAYSAYQNLAYYRNSTWIIEPRNPPEDPPLWRNSVSIYNYCTNQFDVIYSHDYAYNQIDCSHSSNHCGGWAGVAERFPGSSSKPPVVLEQVFGQMTLDYDGQSTRLKAWNSGFQDPSVTSPEWNLYQLFPNASWVAGGLDPLFRTVCFLIDHAASASPVYRRS